MKKGVALLVVALLAVTLAVPLMTEDSSAADITCIVSFDKNAPPDEVSTIPIREWKLVVNELPKSVQILSAYKTIDNLWRKTSEGGYFVFSGWNTDPNADTGLENVILTNETTTLYAVWIPGFNISGYLKINGEPFNKDGKAEETYARMIIDEKTYKSFVSIGDDGKFSVTVPSKIITPGTSYGVPTGQYYVGFYTSGQEDILNYKIQGVPSTVTYNEDPYVANNKRYVVAMDETKTWSTATGYEYMITGTVSSKDCFILYYLNETAIVSGMIKSDKSNYTISGAKVEVIDGNGDIVKNINGEGKNFVLSDNGLYTINKCPVGNYKIRITALDYEILESNIIKIEADKTNEFNFYLTPKPTQTYLGFDLPHFMMVVGASLAAMLFLSALIVRRKARRRPSLLKEKEE